MSRNHRLARVVKGHPHHHGPHQHKNPPLHQHPCAEQVLSCPSGAPLTASDGPLTDDTILCGCHQVSVKQVKEAIANGAATVEQVMTLTDLGSACSHCVGRAWPIIQELLGTP